MRNLKQKFQDWKYRLLKKLVYKYGRVLGNQTLKDDKINFEKSLLNLLKKYKVIRSTQKLQHIEIIADVNEFPKIKIETLII